MKNFLFPGVVWNSVIDFEKEIMIIEWRDPNERKVDYASLDLKSSKLIFQNLPEDKPGWWTGVAGATEGTFFLYDTPDPSFPEHKGIYAFDSRNGKLLWDNQNAVFSSAFQGIIEAYIDKKPVQLYSRDGSTTDSPDERSSFKDVITPDRYDEEDETWNKLSLLLEKITDKTPSGTIEYAETNDKLIISYKVDAANHLLVLTDEGKKLFSEKLDEGGGKLFESFMIYNDQLIFVRNKNELLIFGL